MIAPVDAIAKTMVHVRGSYALEVMIKDYLGEIWVARKGSPMIIGILNGETYVVSDIPVILKFTKQINYIKNHQVAQLKKGEIYFFDFNGDEVSNELVEIKWSAETAEKDGYEYFMMKEIHEQPKAVADTLTSVLED